MHSRTPGCTAAGLGILLSLHCRPYESGEVVVQSYNTVLTLSHLSSVSDGIVLVENSTLNSTCQKVLKIARPSIHVSSVPVQASVWGAPLGSALAGPV